MTKIARQRVLKLTNKVYAPRRIRDRQANGTVVTNSPTNLVSSANDVISEPRVCKFACALGLGRRKREESGHDKALGASHCGVDRDGTL